MHKRHGSIQWRDGNKTEIGQFDEYDTSKYLGKDLLSPAGYKKIQVHLLYDVNNDERHKAKLVANGNLTNIPVGDIYSGVVSLRGI